MRKYDILSVDESLETLMAIASSLEDKGYQVTTASSGEIAVKMMRIKKFDLVITDINMCDVDGVAVLKKAKELNPDTAVMILTGNRDARPRLDTFCHGADDVMLKPCKPGELWKVVAKCLKRSELEQRQQLELHIAQEARASPSKDLHL
ncbi:MAG: response regulator [Deltaproteobacteria bacterium]|nr:response regulator [Deltaproteobacteria bacterium]MBW2075621.1 response regulator [Deltaproteobacteria bacterium]